MLGHSIVSQHFMEPEGSIPNSQELSTCSYPEPDQSSPQNRDISINKGFIIYGNKIKLNLSLRLTKHCATEPYGGVDV
jgi:hypothetical protein